MAEHVLDAGCKIADHYAEALHHGGKHVARGLRVVGVRFGGSGTAGGEQASVASRLAVYEIPGFAHGARVGVARAGKEIGPVASAMAYCARALDIGIYE